MKFYIYERNYLRVFQICKQLLQEMGYKVHSSAPDYGLINAFKTGRFTHIIDLKVSYEPSAVRVILMPGIASGDFLHISYDAASGHTFAERLFNYLQEDDDLGNEFTLNRRNKKDFAEIRVSLGARHGLAHSR
jgi:hypothetical protein